MKSLPLRPITLVATKDARRFAEVTLEKLKAAGIPCALVDVEERVFSDGEYFVHIEHSVRNTTAFAFCCPFYPNPTEGSMRMGILLNALHHASPVHVYPVIPYLPFMRQDRKARSRTPLTAQLIIDMMTMYRSVAGVITVNMHSQQLQSAFPIPTDNLYSEQVLVPHMRNHVSKMEHGSSDFVVVAPDVGSAKRARNFAKMIDENMSVAIIDKERTESGNTFAHALIGDINGKNVIIIDDLIATGGTLIQAAELVRQRGAKSVTVCATHGVFSPSNGVSAEVNLRAAGLHIVTTNTIPRDAQYEVDNSDWLTIIPIDPLIAEAVSECCHYGGSVSGIDMC